MTFMWGKDPQNIFWDVLEQLKSNYFQAEVEIMEEETTHTEILIETEDEEKKIEIDTEVKTYEVIRVDELEC